MPIFNNIKTDIHWFGVYRLLLFIGIFFFWHSNLHADNGKQATRYEVTPYLWAASISGTAAVDGDSSPPIDSDYNFFSLDNLDGVASATFNARGQHWGFLFDFLYVAYEDTFLEGSLIQVTPRLEGRIFEIASTYQPASVNDLDIVAGLRWQDIDVELGFLGRTPQATVDWVDPFVGVIFMPSLTESWFLSLRGDIGGFGIESETAVNAEAMLRYQFNKTFAAKFGYRYLKVKFEDSSLVYDIGLDGFLLGLGIRF
jgi:hypothetical protein